MARLSQHDFATLQRTIVELYAYRDLEVFRREIPGVLLGAIPADYFGLADLGVDMARKTVRVLDYWESSLRIEPEMVPQMERIGFDHPFTKHSMDNGGPTPLMFSDFYSLRQLRGVPMYREFYRGADIGRLLAVPSFTGAGMATLNFCRRASERDFTERDRLVLSLLQPHFDQAWRNAALATESKTNGAKPLESYDLTPRETEIGRWVAEGKTNPEIAMILHARVRTVEKHVESILRKLGVENRTTAAVTIARAQAHPGRAHSAR